jgi:hypothetical protein
MDFILLEIMDMLIIKVFSFLIKNKKTREKLLLVIGFKESKNRSIIFIKIQVFKIIKEFFYDTCWICEGWQEKKF